MYTAVFWRRMRKLDRSIRVVFICGIERMKQYMAINVGANCAKCLMVDRSTELSNCEITYWPETSRFWKEARKTQRSEWNCLYEYHEIRRGGHMETWKFVATSRHDSIDHVISFCWQVTGAAGEHAWQK